MLIDSVEMHNHHSEGPPWASTVFMPAHVKGRQRERERERDGRKYRDKNTGSLPFVGEISHNGVCIQFRTRQTVFRS